MEHKIWHIEGPYYADRVCGCLTFRDWEDWTKEDQDKWRDDPRVPREYLIPIEWVTREEILRKFPKAQ